VSVTAFHRTDHLIGSDFGRGEQTGAVPERSSGTNFELGVINDSGH